MQTVARTHLHKPKNDWRRQKQINREEWAKETTGEMEKEKSSDVSILPAFLFDSLFYFFCSSLHTFFRHSIRSLYVEFYVHVELSLSLSPFSRLRDVHHNSRGFSVEHCNVLCNKYLYRAFYPIAQKDNQKEIFSTIKCNLIPNTHTHIITNTVTVMYKQRATE